MEYTRLGTTGLTVSRIGLGCMSYGDATAGHHPWAIDEENAQPFFRQAFELGITLFDTANVYSQGTSEEFLGRAITRYSSRDDVVVATKLTGKMGDGPGGVGLSRRAIFEQVDASLTRLGTDFIDLYQIHRFDQNTPVEETMEALHDLVKSGKVRYIGASSMFAWQLAKMQTTAAVNGWTKFVSMQDNYSLVKREEEREMLPLCTDLGMGVIPYSPQAGGRLTRPLGSQTKRTSTDHFAHRHQSPLDEPIINEVQSIAEKRGVSMATIAIAWVLGRPYITAPIVGATKVGHLEDAIAGLDIMLTAEELEALESPYVAQAPFWV